MKTILKWSGIVFGGLIGLFLLTGMALYSSGMKKLIQTYPNIAVETINIPTDAAAPVAGTSLSSGHVPNAMVRI